jgi:cytochrome c biogenesis protein CcdA
MKGVLALRWSLLMVAALGIFSATFFGDVAFAEDLHIIEVLERKDCGHCQTERAFLSDMLRRRSDMSVRFFDIDTAEGQDIFKRITAREGLAKATPITIVGGNIVQGFDAPETTGRRFEALLEASRGKKSVTFEQYLSGTADAGSRTERIAGATCEDGGVCPLPSSEKAVFRLPFTEKMVDVSEYSLPTLAVVLGFIDGFNPCAMWVLVTFLLILSQTKSRKRLLQVAGLFLVAEAVMYYLILNVWFTTWDFVGLDRIVTPIVGMVAVGGGLFFLYEWYTSLGTEMACRIVDAERRSKILQKIKAFVSGEFTWLAALGVIGLAFTVNVIEFACSIGIPQAFTKIIELNDLGWLSTEGLMAIYILFYMFDDMLVFALALWGFEKLHLTEKYSRWSALVGGMLMILLGYLLIVHPEVVSQLK